MRTTLDRNKLALMAIDMAQMEREGILGIGPKGIENLPTVHVGAGVLGTLFPGTKRGYIPDWSPDYSCHFVDYMGVRFYALTPIEVDIYDEEGEG